MHKVWILGLAVGLASAPVQAAPFASYDTNSDGMISKDEFYGSVADVGTYSDWDADNDGLLSESEFGDLGVDWDYTAWDADDNDYLDSGEFYDSYYAEYDANEDSHWEQGEWDDAGEAGLFDW